MYGRRTAVSAWDAGRLSWKWPIGDGLAISSSRVAIVEQPPAGDATVTLLRSGDGVTEARIAIPPWPHVYSDGDLALSDDRLVVLAGDGLRVHDLRTGGGELITVDATGVEAFALHPKEPRIAVAQRGGGIDVYQRDDRGWRPIAHHAAASCPHFTGRGLAFADPEGHHLTDGDRSVAFVPADFSRFAPSYPKEARPRYTCDSWRFSDDGRWLISWQDWSLTVTSSTSSEVVFRHQWLSRPLVGLCSMGFSASRMRAVTCSGILLEIDLDRRLLTRSKDLGPRIRSSHNLFQEGASVRAIYEATLSPSGDKMVMRRGSRISVHDLR